MARVFGFKKTISCFVLICMLVTALPCIAFAENDGNNYDETDYVIRYAIYDTSSVSSGWDKNMPFPLKSSPREDGTTINIVNDGSSQYPAESYLALSDIKGGIVTIDFDFSMDRLMDDTTFRLLGNKKTIFGITTKGNGLYLEQPNGNVYLTDYSAVHVNPPMIYVVKAVLDFDNRKILSIQINGTTYAVNKPFVNDIGIADGFDISTGKEAIGILTNRRLTITGGYFVTESFWNPDGILPDDWKVTSNGGKAVLEAQNHTRTDRYNLRIDSAEGALNYTKKIDPLNGRLVFEINVLQPEKRDDFNINLLGDGKKIVSLTSDGTNFCYEDKNGRIVPFYDYLNNMWYHLTIDFDLINSVADIYLNQQLKVSGVEINNAKVIDTIDIYAGASDKSLSVDDVMLSRKTEYAPDYPSAPVIPEKKDDDILVGMQMCPLWTQGGHWGWDYIKASSNRREPVLGFYDECSPEAADWMIKYMAEHGVDYMNICSYPAKPFDASDKLSPEKDIGGIRQTWLLNAIRNGKYSHDMKFALLYESDSVVEGYDFYDSFFEVLWPFYIENYFKDERYMKVDGRPLFSVFSIDKFLKVFDDGSGGDAPVKAGVERMRQMCIDAGVGNPYIILNTYYRDNDIERVAKLGFDGVSAYGYNYNTTFTFQKTRLTEVEELCSEFGIDLCPSVTPMRDDTSWRRFSGYWHNQEEFEGHLDWMQNELLANSNSSVSKKIINMCTWDEFGEGHIICPTVGMGFQYLDAIRSSITKGGEHTDEIPTEAQKARINHLYRQDRKVAIIRKENNEENVAPINKKVYHTEREGDVEEKIPTNVKRGWYSNSYKDVSDITVAEGISEMNNTDKGLEIYPSAEYPAIQINNIDDIDIYDVTYIKIRMKKNPTSGGGFLYFTTDVSRGGDFVEENKVYFNAGNSDGKEFEDFYVPVSEAVPWTGRLKSLKIILGDVSDYTTPFVIESVELLADEVLTEGDKMVIDGWTQAMDDPVVVKDGTLMLPLRFTGYSCGVAEINSYELTDTYTVFYNNRFSEIKLGEEKAVVGGADVHLSQAAYKVSDIINDTVYVPIDFLEEVLYDKAISWDESSRMVVIESQEVEENKVNREIVHEVHFDSETDVTATNGLAPISFSGGVMTATTSNSDPQFAFMLQKPAIDIKFVEIKINTSARQAFNFYFNTDVDTVWNEMKRSSVYFTSAGDNTIMIDTSQIPTWKDTINRIRFDPADTNGQTFAVDSIIFYGEEIAGVAEQSAMSSCVINNGNVYEWTFNKNTRIDGWEGNRSLGNVRVVNGKLNATVVGPTPMISNVADINIDAEKISSISIKYSNMTNSRKTKMYFMTDNMKTWSEACSVEFAVNKMDPKYTEYVVDAARNENWKGNIKRIMFVPEGGYLGSIIIDKISLKLKSE